MIYSVSLKNRKQKFILNLSKSKRKFIKLLAVDDSVFMFLLLWYIRRSYWVRDGCSAIIFVKHIKTVVVQVLSYSAQCSADTWIVALLWKLPQMPSCSANNANLDKNNFDMFYQFYCCAAINGQIWMNNVPNESRIIMLSCTEISFVISVSNFEKVGVKPGFFSFINSPVLISLIKIFLFDMNWWRHFKLPTYSYSAKGRYGPKRFRICIPYAWIFSPCIHNEHLQCNVLTSTFLQIYAQSMQCINKWRKLNVLNCRWVIVKKKSPLWKCEIMGRKHRESFCF